jgi:hypothetical protein
MTVINFLVDDNQWLDAVVKERSGKRRTLQEGDIIEIQLHVDISKTLAWGPSSSDAKARRNLVRIYDGLYYFSGELMEVQSRHIDVDQRSRGGSCGRGWSIVMFPS